ncbi:hypothetical protein H0H87_008048, partial [Tephrocybe sp. NHM501043]
MVLPGASDSVVDGVDFTVHDSTPQVEASGLGKSKLREVTVLDEANARLKMPAPRLKDAPEFKGTNVTDFLDDVERCADTAGLQYSALPSIALCYCARKVRNVVERASVWEEDDWAKVPDQEITQNETNRYFFKGLPNPFRVHIFDKIPDGSGVRVPNVDQQMKWIRQYFDKQVLYDEVK